MDYCHPCQRHLNGALACAGCGTPADALAPYAVPAAPARPGRDEGPASETSRASGTTGHRRRAPETPSRRRGRRGHRRRGRTLLLTATGVVLAVGALSLAELAIEPGGDSGAAEYVSEAADAATARAPSASSDVEPGDAGPVDEPTVVPVTASHSGTATDRPAGSSAPGASAPAAGPETPSPSASASEPDEPGDPGGTEPPAHPSGSTGPTTAPTSPAPSDEPTPTPSPSETCTPWLWWCV